MAHFSEQGLRLHDAVTRHFGVRGSSPGLSSATNEVTLLLYRSVALHCSVSDGVLTATLTGGLDHLFPGMPAEVVGQVPDWPQASASLDALLDEVGDLARRRLPSAYLAEFEATMHLERRFEPGTSSAKDGQKLDFPALAALTSAFWNRALTEVTISEPDHTIRGLLYREFDFSAGLDRYGTFEAGITVDNTYAVRNYLGEVVSLNNTRSHVVHAYLAIDRWCLLRLPLRPSPRRSLRSRARFGRS